MSIIFKPERKELAERLWEESTTKVPEMWNVTNSVTPTIIIITNDGDAPISIEIPDEHREAFYEVTRRMFENAVASMIIAEATVTEYKKDLDIEVKKDVLRVQIERLYDEELEIREWEVFHGKDGNLPSLGEMKTFKTKPDIRSPFLIIKRNRN
jgi:hypothetical protein